MHKYDLALSYASEQKDYVSSVYKLLKLKGLSVYFASAYQEELTGIDMTEEFYSIFHDQCLFIAAFVSNDYLQAANGGSCNWADAEQRRKAELSYSCILGGCKAS